MRTITTLVFVFISTFSLFSQTSIEKRIDYCRIIGRQDSVVYYVSYMKMGKDSINVFIKSDNVLEQFLGRPSTDKELKQFRKDFLKLEQQNPIIEINRQQIPFNVKLLESIRTCTPTFILYKKKGDKIFVRIQLENFSYATAGEYDYFISLEFKGNKCISSKIEEVPWSNLNKYKKGKKQQ